MSIGVGDVSILVAVVGLVGVVVGAVSNRASQLDASRISLLDVTVQNLTKRIEALEASLASAEAKRDEAKAKVEELGRERWHAILYARKLLLWAHALVKLIPEGILAPPEPEPPPEIEDEM